MKKLLVFISLCMFSYTLSECMNIENQLLDAIENNREDTVRILINQNINVNSKNKSNATTLMFASYIGNEKIVDMLLGAGAKIDEQDVHGITALIVASAFGHLLTVKKLIAKGANLNNTMVTEFTIDKQTFPKGSTALMLAINENHTDIAIELIKAGADVSIKDGNNKTALDIAKSKKNQAIIDLLEKKLGDTENFMKSLQKLQHSLANVSKLLKG